MKLLRWGSVFFVKYVPIRLEIIYSCHGYGIIPHEVKLRHGGVRGLASLGSFEPGGMLDHVRLIVEWVSGKPPVGYLLNQNGFVLEWKTRTSRRDGRE
jgi:hypothetical protein